MRICFLVGVALAVLQTMLTQSASAQSLFERRSVNQVYQYRDYAARHRGDILSVLINESTELENRDERSLDKTGSSSNSAGFDYGLGGGIGNTAGNSSLSHATQSQRAFTGDTEFRSERQFTDRFTVTVVDVLPNGNLVISGSRRIAVQGDVRELKLTGIVRQFDILPNNSVPSFMVANLKLELEAQGAEQAYSKQGWFSRRMNKWWPF